MKWEYTIPQREAHPPDGERLSCGDEGVVGEIAVRVDRKYTMVQADRPNVTAGGKSPLRHNGLVSRSVRELDIGH